ncbi:MAG TPA: SIR2 family protein [Enhygromyxa sp.]|nr:SIR2 family protein [Enhygromyxa sp.]
MSKHPDPRANSMVCPRHLSEEIVAGNCVAFVGAGFSAAARLPAWTELLRELAGEVGESLRRAIEGALDRDTGADGRYLAAQLLEDGLGRARLVERLRERLVVPREQLGPTMVRRLQILRRIPFRAILTTNFDNMLAGEVASRDTYVAALRPQRHRWWERHFWVDHEGPPVLEIHGDLSLADAEQQLVLTRRDYRRRLYQDPGYQTFLRTVLSTRTVLYLGFSFTDAYLNELRSEILHLLDFRHGSFPVAYAVVADSPLEVREFYRHHEGIELLDFRIGEHPDGGRDFSGFDRWLEAIYEASSPRPRFARMLAGRRVLWLDPHPENNVIVYQFFASIASERLAGARLDPVAVTQVATAEQARDALLHARGREQPFDLVLSHWGADELVRHGDELLANGPRLLVLMRQHDLRAPVVLFSSRTDFGGRKRTALGLGARAYCFSHEALFREIEAVFDGEP